MTHRIMIVTLLGFALLACPTDPEGGEDAGAVDGGGGSDAADTQDAATSTITDCSISEFAACGGDLVGTWTINETCQTPVDGYFDDPSIACSDADVSTILDRTGTITFEAGGSYQKNVVVNGATTERLDDECLAEINMPTTGEASVFCGNREGLDGYDTCTFANQWCSCEITDEVVTDQESGTYTVSEGTLDLTGGVAATLAFCVDGNTLVLEWFRLGSQNYHYMILTR